MALTVIHASTVAFDAASSKVMHIAIIGCKFPGPSMIDVIARGQGVNELTLRKCQSKPFLQG